MLALALGLGACEGAIYEPPGGAVAAPSGGQASVSGGAGGAPAAELPLFAVPMEQPVLLPFEVRLNKVAAVVGLPVSDPVFDLLRQNATQLGAYDFGGGIVPDGTWTALRLSVWAQSVVPVCSSPAFSARFARLPEQLGPFIEAAYGRSMTADDVADAELARQDLQLTPDQLTRTLCVALLSSTELVLQ